MKTLIKLIIILISSVVLNGYAFATSNQVVNVLTWWGYFDNETSKVIEDKCNVTMSYDTYHSNDDMLERLRSSESKYDVLIFSDTIYDAIGKEIKLKNSDLSKKSLDYNPVIKKHFIRQHYPKNIAYFFHALTGFVWNPSVINLTNRDTVQSAFAKAKKNKVIILDDPVEINMLLSSGMRIKNANDSLSIKNIKKVTQDARVYISNNINQIYDQKDFAFSYQWSGLAYKRFVKTNKFHFLISPDLSYISTDLIAQIKDNRGAACVANYLASKEFLTYFQVKTYYFSPYVNIEGLPEGPYKIMYKNFITNLASLRWLELPSAVQLKKFDQQWDVMKYELSKNSK
jgi:spermidine/putrescine transport system substrate-binding protein